LVALIRVERRGEKRPCRFVARENRCVQSQTGGPRTPIPRPRRVRRRRLGGRLSAV